MVYTDGIHIISDSGVQELHWFAERVGIGRWWFEKDKSYYGLPKELTTNDLIIKGAKYATTRHIQRILKIKPDANMLPK